MGGAAVSVALALLVLAAASDVVEAQAPGWDAQFVVDPFPPPYLSDWETNPTVATLTVTNGTAEDAYLTIHFTVTDGGGGVVLSGRSDPQWAPAGTPTVFSTASTLDGTSSYDPALEEIIVRTGRFPEGDYTACVTLTDETGLVVADNLCAFFSAFMPDPPYLLFPLDGDTVSIQDPIFEWTPLLAPVTVQPRYVVQIAEILPGQTPFEALDSRILQYEEANQFMPAFQYPLGAQPFRQGQEYAWWVRALDQNDYPLATNQGRSEIWTFTYFSEDGGESPGEEVGGAAQLLPRSFGGSAADVVDLASVSYQAARDQLTGSADRRIRLPLPDVDFVPLELWNVRVDSDDAQRALAIRATASLPHASVDLLLVGSWDETGNGQFSLGLDPAVLRLTDWIEGLEGSPLGELSFDGSILTLASRAGSLDVGTLPPLVQEFYGVPTVPLVAGVSLQHSVDLEGTALGERLASLGLDVGRAQVSGDLGIDASALFDDPEAMAAPTLDLRVSVDVDGLDGVPEWLRVDRVGFRVTNDPGFRAELEAEVGAEVAEAPLDFLLRADITNADGSSPLTLTGRSLTAWEQPLGIEWLTVDSTRLTLAAPREGVAASGMLEGWITVGEETVALQASLEGEGDEVQGVLSATIAALSVGDLLTLLREQTGNAGLGGQVPGDVASLENVRFELRSGEPPTFTISATANAFGRSTEFLYTMVPPDLSGLGGGGAEAGGEGTSGGGGGSEWPSTAGLLAIRLPDWSLSELVPSIGGSPFGDLSFPSVSFVMPTLPSDWLEPEPLPGPTPPDDPGVRTQWQIPWGSLSGMAQEFLMPSWPCAGATGCGGAGVPGGETGGGGGFGFEGLSLGAGLNFSAPISMAELSAALGGLFDFSGSGGTGGNLPPGESSDVVLQGSPGISLAGLLSGELDLTGLLNIRGYLPPLPETPPLGWPDWLRPTEPSLLITSEPGVRVEASVVLVADLDGEKVFDLTAQATNASGGGAAAEGFMRGRWDQPYGLEWLALDSVHIALAAGSVGPRVALGAGVLIGGTTAALDIDVRGASDARTLDFSGLAHNLSTADVATFLNDAFDAGVAVPTDPITLDSLTIAFSTADAGSFDITGAFSAGMDAADALNAVAELIPGAGTPGEPPFSIGTLGSAWFELHAVADSSWGAFGGGVELGEAGGSALQGTASVTLGSGTAGAGEWVLLDMELAGSDLRASDAVVALEATLPGGWTIPPTFAAAEDVTLETVLIRVGLDSRTDSASVELSGNGRLERDGGSSAASAALRLFDVTDTTWADGALSVALSDVSVTQGLAQAASLLPGDWAVPEDVSALAPIQLDTAALTVGFDSRADSISATIGGAGTMDGGTVRVTTDLSLVQLPTLEWAVGWLDVRIGEVALPDALARVANVLPGDWSLPAAMDGLAPIVLDSARLGLAFDTRDATFSAALTGASHMGEGAGRLDGTTELRLATADADRVIDGRVTLGVADLDLDGLLRQAGQLLAGDWALPDDFTGFDALALDSAFLDVGFSTRTDSLGASVRGLGRLADGGGDVSASASIELASVGEISGARGALELVAADLTMTQALERIGSLLPGDWALPEGLEAFDAVALDSAGFVVGFDTWVDSVFAGVAGSGSLGELTADTRLDFTHLPAGDRAAGLITIQMGAVGAGEAIESVAELLPGDWALPDGFASFDELQLDRAALQAGFDTQGDSLWAGFDGAGQFRGRTADARLGFTRVSSTSYGNGRLSMSLGDVSLDDAFSEVASLLPGDWQAPSVGFDIGSLRDVALQVGFDTRTDSLWAGVEAGATLGARDGIATLAVVSVGGEGGATRSWVEGTFTVDIGDVTLTEALDVAVGMIPSAPPVPQLGFDLGGLSEAVLEAGFRVGSADSTWAGLSGRFDMGGLTGRAEVGLALGADQPSGTLTADFDDSFTVPDVVSLMTSFLPGGGIELPPLGPLDLSLDEPLLTLEFGERSGLSLGGTSQLFGKQADALFSMARVDGRPQLIFGVQVPDLGFTDILPDFSNPVTDALRLDLAALTLTRAEGRVEDEELSPAERSFYQPLAGGGDDFSIDFRPGLNLTGLIPLANAGAMKDMVDMLSPGASNLTLQGTLPLPGFGGLRDMSLAAALPPMRPPGSPAWFVEGEIAVQITGRPSVGVAGALTVDVEGDTLTFDIESNVAVVPAGVELSIAGGLAARNPWVGPLGIEWMTLNEIRLALGLSPVAVRLGFLGDAAFGEKSFRVALGTKLNIYTGVPIGALVLGESPEGMSLGDLAAFHRQISGPDAPALPTESLPDMAVRDLGIRVATYTDFDLGIEAGIAFGGALFIQTSRGGSLDEFARVDLSIDADGIIGYGSLGAFSVGPVHFDDALFDLAITIPDQHLIISGGVTIDNAFSADVDLAMSRDSLRFATDFMLFDAFRTNLDVRAGFELTNPSFAVHAALYPEFSDELMIQVFGDLLPVGSGALTAAADVLAAADATLDDAQQTLDDAIWVASEAARTTMNAAYDTYRYAASRYSTASSNYSYYSSRCHWTRPVDCSRAAYWGSVRSFWSTQRSIAYGAYIAARTAYQNQDWLESSVPVQTARAALDDARAAFNGARAEVERMQTSVDQMAAWLDAVQACATCPRPPVPVRVVSAEFDAALDGFFGQSGVQLAVAYQVFGESRSLTAGFSGSLSDVASSLFTELSDALF